MSLLLRLPAPQAVDQVGLDVESGRGLDEQSADLPVVRRDQDCTVEAITVQYPPRQEKGGALVAFREALGTSDPVGENCRSVHRILQRVDGSERALNAVEVVGLVEPL